MRRFILLTLIAVIAGLFTAGQGLANEVQMGRPHAHPALNNATSQTGQNVQSEASNTGVSNNVKMGRKGAHPTLNNAKSDTETVELTMTQIRKLQTLLNQKGYDVGQADGVIGPQTEHGLTQYQQSQGLATTGQPNRETLRNLAPTTQEQEFFGLSPAYGQNGQQKMEHEQMNKQQMENTLKKH